MIPRGIELRRPWGSRTSTLVCTYGHQTTVPTDGAPSTCPVCNTETHADAVSIEGRTTPPTDAEIEAHWRAGGTWLVQHQVIRERDLARLYVSQFAGFAVVWIALDATGRPCAWPVVAWGIGGCPVCCIANRDGSCDCADCATLEGKAANDPDTCYPARCPKHQGAP